jgi:hypothetical protein
VQEFLHLLNGHFKENKEEYMKQFWKISEKITRQLGPEFKKIPSFMNKSFVFPELGQEVKPTIQMALDTMAYAD